MRINESNTHDSFILNLFGFLALVCDLFIFVETKTSQKIGNFRVCLTHEFSNSFNSGLISWFVYSCRDKDPKKTGSSRVYLTHLSSKKIEISCSISWFVYFCLDKDTPKNWEFACVFDSLCLDKVGHKLTFFNHCFVTII